MTKEKVNLLFPRKLLVTATRIATIWASMYHIPAYSVSMYNTDKLMQREMTFMVKNNRSCLGMRGLLFLKVHNLFHTKLFRTATVNPRAAEKTYHM